MHVAERGSSRERRDESGSTSPRCPPVLGLPCPAARPRQQPGTASLPGRCVQPGCIYSLVSASLASRRRCGFRTLGAVNNSIQDFCTVGPGPLPVYLSARMRPPTRQPPAVIVRLFPRAREHHPSSKQSSAARRRPTRSTLSARAHERLSHDHMTMIMGVTLCTACRWEREKSGVRRDGYACLATSVAARPLTKKPTALTRPFQHEPRVI